MTLGELRSIIGEKNFGKVPYCNKIYINVDDNDISVGLPKSFLYGMRATANMDMDIPEYLEFEQLLRDEDIYTISDGGYDVYIPKGVRVPLVEDLSDWEVYLSDKLEKEIEKYIVSQKRAVAE